MRIGWGRTKKDARDDYNQVPASTSAASVLLAMRRYVPMPATVGPYITEAVGLYVPKSAYNAGDWTDAPIYECEYCGPLSTNELSRDKAQCTYCGGSSQCAVWGE